MDGNGGVDEVMRCQRSVISLGALSVYLDADLMTLSAMCLFILELGRFSKGLRIRLLDALVIPSENESSIWTGWYLPWI